MSKNEDSKADNKRDSEPAESELELNANVCLYLLRSREALNTWGWCVCVAFCVATCIVLYIKLLLRPKSRTNAAALSLAALLLYERVASMIGVEIRGTLMHVLHRRHAINSSPPYVCYVHKPDVICSSAL